MFAVFLAGILQGVDRTASVYSIMPISNVVTICGSKFPPSVSKHCQHQHSATNKIIPTIWNNQQFQPFWYPSCCFLNPTSHMYSYGAVNRGKIINSKVKWVWNGDGLNKTMNISVIINSQQTNDVCMYVKFSQCTDWTALTGQWHKTIMQILKVLSTRSPRKTK